MTGLYIPEPSQWGKTVTRDYTSWTYTTKRPVTAYPGQSAVHDAAPSSRSDHVDGLHEPLQARGLMTVQLLPFF
ncbi:hypothetical protein PGTUg99_019375 [Puccinia graminis f. sp. tritici]|uniref:Uncharacterized protein n=1 Tax=Puccinia graminis f. sp. tritici TaxID=56615 RepID=A0A5B0SHY3_PUCGR|nr:hypothetical protein PGTUg99_019375 [Puccinia graminis f. sp. tritici]